MPNRILPDGTSQSVAELLERTHAGDYSDTDLLDMIEFFKVIDVYITHRSPELALYARTQIVHLSHAADHRRLRKQERSDKIATSNPGELKPDERPEQPPR